MEGNFFYIHEKLPVTFKNLRFLRLEVCHPLDLDLLFSYMPNLIELQLEGLNFEVLKLQNPINLRYLKLPFIFPRGVEITLMLSRTFLILFSCQHRKTNFLISYRTFCV